MLQTLPSLYLPDFLFYWAHLCILRSELICITFCLSRCLDWTIIHISESIRARNLKFYHIVVVTPASMLRWIWPNLECNLKTRDSEIWPHKSWPAYCGNVEGVGLKQNSQSTTHIDPQVGTGGMVRVYYWLLKFVTQINIGKGSGAHCPKLGGHDLETCAWKSRV